MMIEEEEPETRMERTNGPVSSTRIRRLYRLVIVCFGLLLLLQVLSTVLRLLMLRSDTDLEAVIGNLTEERDMLKNKLELLVPDSDVIMKDFTEKGDTFDHLNSSDATIIKTLTDEREALQRRLRYFESYAKKGWVFFQNSFYYISSTKKSWQESRQDCRSREADLVIISNKEEQDFIRQFEKITWIGLTDTKTEGTWEWVDGTLLNTSYWKTTFGTTDDASGENEKKKSWDGGGCENNNFWICEKIMVV